MADTGAVGVALVGYGMAGRTFHQPLLQAAGLDVRVVATRDPQRQEQALADLPGPALVDDLDAVLARRDELGVELVVLASPTGAHVDQALACIDAGTPFVVDKPLAVDAVGGRRVVERAEQAGVPMCVFQNRRYDDEHRTLRQLLADGVLGDVLRYEKRWERWRPVPKDRWRERATAVEGGGLLLDLHSHLVDGAVQLLGRVVEVHAELATRTTAAEDDAFLSLLHESGVRSHLGALSTAAAPGPRTRVLGSQAAYVVTEFEGEVTGFPGLASPDDEHTGWVVRGDERSPARTAPGEPADFYREVAAAVRGLGPVPVAPSDAVHVLDVLDAARVSDREHSVVRL
ncbi:Gfo/Idh/MocA family protein [Angustibacter aerolatus]